MPASSATPQSQLLRWYRRHGRDLPWRHTRDPYRIALSETMLQQTQVERVIPYYQHFLELYPNAAALAAADIQDLHRLWKGLGFPSRIERLQRACASVVEQHQGAWPQTVEALQTLPGIGPYTASAIATFAFGQAVAVVDTNIARVYTRRDGLPLPLDRRQVWLHAAHQVHPKQPIEYTNALMDLGAAICTARAPRCAQCPWQQRCLSQGAEELLEASSNPLRVASSRKVYSAKPQRRGLPRIPVVLALVHQDGRYLVAKRPRRLRHGGHWELPGGKREDGESDRQALARELMEETGLDLLSARPFVTVYDEGDDSCVVLNVYRCRVFNPEQAQARASDAIRWVDPKEFLSLDFPPANAAILARFRDYHRLA